MERADNRKKMVGGEKVDNMRKTYHKDQPRPYTGFKSVKKI